MSTFPARFPTPARRQSSRKVLWWESAVWTQMEDAVSTDPYWLFNIVNLLLKSHHFINKTFSGMKLFNFLKTLPFDHQYIPQLFLPQLPWVGEAGRCFSPLCETWCCIYTRMNMAWRRVECMTIWVTPYVCTTPWLSGPQTIRRNNMSWDFRLQTGLSISSKQGQVTFDTKECSSCEIFDYGPCRVYYYKFYMALNKKNFSKDFSKVKQLKMLNILKMNMGCITKCKHEYEFYYF